MIEAQNTETNELKPWEKFGKTEQLENELKPWEKFAKAKESNFYAPRAFERERLYKAFAGDPLAVLDDNLRPEMEFYANREANPDEMRKRVALAAYFSMMDKKKFSFALENLDGFLDRYYAYTGKKMDVNGAYEDISGMLATAGKIAPAEQDGSKTGSLLKGSFSQLLGTVYNLGTTLLEGAVQYENAQRNLDGMGARADEIHKDFNEVRDVTAGYYKDIAEKERAKLIDPDWATLEGVQKNGVAGTMKNLTLSVLFEAPNMAAQAAVGAVNPALVPVMMGVTTAADKAYDLERENSAMNEIQQMANIIGTGLVNGYLEKVTMGIFKGSGLKLEPETLKAGMKEAFKYYLKSIGKEGLEESAEQLAENAVDIATGRYGYGETAEERLRIVKEHLFEGVIESGVVGGAYGAPFAGVGHRNLRRADESKNRALNMLRTREAELKAKSDLTEIETAELRHIQTTLESGNLNETLGLAQDVAVEQEAKRRADAEAAVERDAEMTSEERADAARQDYQLRRSMAHNPEDTADAVAETGAGYKVNVRACGTAEIASMETGRNAEEIRAFYDPETDTVVVNTDRVRPSEVPYLFLHEVAVHKGLDAVFGESRKNAVLDGLYGQMHEQIEAVNTGYGFDLDTTEGRRAATEEYLAECAEFCGHDWRKFDRENEEDVTRWLAEHNMALMRRKEGVRGVLEERGELSVRPAWWREFLQKVKMFFYGFKGFSNYRFTDKEIETLLLRGYRKTRAMRSAKGEGGDARFAALRREGAPNTAEESGQMRDSRVPHEEGFMEKYKFSGKGLYADYEFLYGRHPEYFEDAEHVRAAVEFVLAQPEEAVDVEGNAAFVRRDEETGTPYRIEIEKMTRAKYNHIRSVHVLSEQQYEKAKAGATPANAASPVLQPSQNRVRQTDTNGDLTGRQGRTVSDFLRYDSTESGKVKHSLEDGSDFSDGADKYTLENAKASKEGYRVERVNENAGRDLTEAQGVVCEVNQVFNPEEAPKDKFFGWAVKKVKEYEKAHPLAGSYNTPALGKNVEVRKSTIRSIGNHGGPDEKFNLYPAVPDMLHNAVLIQSEANIDENTQAVRSYSHILASKVRYGEKRFVAIMVIHESDRICYYDYSILLIEDGTLGMPEGHKIGKKEAAENGSPATAGPSSHTAQVLKVAREALLSSGFDTKNEKNLRFSIEQYSDADWSDMVTYMKAKVGDLLTKSDAEYKKMLESVGMECYSEADAHACAVEAMNANLEDAKARRKEEMMKWIVENNTWIQRIAEVTGSPEFKIRPSYRFQGMDFTGAYISQAWRDCSGNPKAKNREKRLREASGYHSDELAQMIADKFGGDAIEIENDLIEYFQHKKKKASKTERENGELGVYDEYYAFKKEERLFNRELDRQMQEQWESQEAVRIGDEIRNILEEKRVIGEELAETDFDLFASLYQQVTGERAPAHPSAEQLDALNAAIQEGGVTQAYIRGWEAGRDRMLAEKRKEFAEFTATVMQEKATLLYLQREAARFAEKHVAPELRGEFIRGIIGLAEYSSLPTKTYPEGKRKAKLRALFEQMFERGEIARKEKSIAEVEKLFKQAGLRADSGRKQRNLLSFDVQRIVDRCREYADLSAEEAEILSAEMAQRIDNSELTGNAQADLEYEARLLDLFGNYRGKSYPEIELARTELKTLVNTGRSELKQQIRERVQADGLARSDITAGLLNGNHPLTPQQRRALEAKRKREKTKRVLAETNWKSNSLDSLLSYLELPSGGKVEAVEEFQRKLHRSYDNKMARSRKHAEELEAKLNELCGLDPAKTDNLSARKARAELIRKWRERPEKTGIMRHQPDDRTKFARWVRVPADQVQAKLKEFRAHGSEVEAAALEHLLNTEKLRIRRGDVSTGDAITDSLVNAMRKMREADAEKAYYVPQLGLGYNPVEEKLTQLEALYMRLMWNQKNIRYKMRFNGWLETSMKQIDAYLKPEVKEFGDWMVKQLERDRTDIEAVYEKLYFSMFPHEENYFPSVYNPTRETMSGQVTTDLSQEGGNQTMAYTPGGVKLRAFHLMEPKICDALNVFVNHRTQMDHFVTHGETARELRSVFANKDVAQTIRDVYGGEYYDQLKKEILDFIHGGNAEVQNTQFAQTALNNFTRMKMLWNLVSAGKQVFGGVSYFAFSGVPAKAMASGIADFWKHPVQNAKNLLETEYFKNRWQGGMNREMKAIMDSTGLCAGNMQLFMRELDYAGFMLMRAGDALSVLVYGHAVYKYHYEQLVKQGLAPHEADIRAKEEWALATERTQQSGAPHMLNSWQKGNFAQKALVSFLSNPTLLFQSYSRDIYSQKRFGHGGWSAAKKIAVAGICSVLMSAINQMIRNGDDWDEYSLSDAVFSVLNDITVGWVGVGTLMSGIYDALSYGRAKTIPVLDDAGRAVRSGYRIAGEMAEGDLNEENLRDAIALLQGLGLFWSPAAQVSALGREGRRWWQFFTGEKK